MSDAVSRTRARNSARVRHCAKNSRRLRIVPASSDAIPKSNTVSSSPSKYAPMPTFRAIASRSRRANSFVPRGCVGPILGSGRSYGPLFARPWAQCDAPGTAWTQRSRGQCRATTRRRANGWRPPPNRDVLRRAARTRCRPRSADRSGVGRAHRSSCGRDTEVSTPASSRYGSLPLGAVLGAEGTSLNSRSRWRRAISHFRSNGPVLRRPNAGGIT